MRHLLQYAILIALLTALGFFVSRGGQVGRRPTSGHALVSEYTSTPEFLRLCGPLAGDKRPVIVDMIISDDKHDWLEPAAREFGHLCPNIQIKLTHGSSLDVAESIAYGRLHALMWSPSSSTALRYHDYLRQKSTGAAPPRRGPLPSLVRSPIIWLTTIRRYRVLRQILDAQRSPEGQWMQTGCAMVDRAAVPDAPETSTASSRQLSPGSWSDFYSASRAPTEPVPKRHRPRKLAPLPPSSDPPPEEITSWGRVRFGHADPTRSLLGIEALYLLANDYLLPPGTQGAQALGAEGASPEAFKHALARQSDALRDWLQRCEGGMEDFDDSTPRMVSNFLQLGSSRYDVVVSYEQLTLPSLDRVRVYAADVEPIRVFYPTPTLWADHPIVLLDSGQRVEPEQRIAAEKWIAYLLGETQQQRAIEFGFRPSRPEASVRNFKSEKNPFLRLSSRGVQIDVPPATAPPIDGEAAARLMKIWGEATGRY